MPRDRPLKFMLQHPTVWFWQETIEISKQRTAFIWFFCARGWLMSERLWQTALADLCIYKRLKNIRWSNGRIDLTSKLLRYLTTDLWDALKSFILNSSKFKVAPCPIIVSLDANQVTCDMSLSTLGRTVLSRCRGAGAAQCAVRRCGTGAWQTPRVTQRFSPSASHRVLSCGQIWYVHGVGETEAVNR